MFRFSLLITLLLASTLANAAQCTGVFFKESSRQVLSNSFAYSYVEDFDGDGLKDLFGFSPTGSNSYQVFFYKRLTANAFDPTARTSTITDVAGIFGNIGDVNGDGKMDLIIPHGSSPRTLTTYLNDGTGRFNTTTPAINAVSDEQFWVAGDLNNDGKADVLSLVNSTTTLSYRLAQADNSFGPPVAITNIPSGLPTAVYYLNSNAGIIVEDLNGDNWKDIAFTPGSGNTLRVLTNSGNGTFNQTLNTSFVRTSNRLKTVDLNSDGKRDFLSNVFQDLDGTRVKLLTNAGNNTFTSSETVVPVDFLRQTYYVNDYFSGDFDGDGLTDVILPGDKKYQFLKNTGGTTFNQTQFRGYLDLGAFELIDGDSKTDGFSLVRSFIDGHYWLGGPSAVYYTKKVVAFKKNSCDAVGQTKTIDFDGDGATDRAFWNPANGIWRYYTGVTQNSQLNFQWGGSGDIPVPNDYDGDGITDFAIFRRIDGNWWIRKSADQQVSVVNYGLNNDKPVPADFDGDGRADLAVFRPSDGNWYIMLSQSGQTQVIRFGISEDKPLPADFDGDGKADVSVYRPSSGVWYRLNSSDGSFFAVKYGISTDKPVPADFDGDGKANIAVYRDGLWYILKSDYSTFIFQWGTSNDLPFLAQGFEPSSMVYRRTSSSIYANNFPEVFSGLTTTYSTGSSFSESFVSTILPSE